MNRKKTVKVKKGCRTVEKEREESKETEKKQRGKETNTTNVFILQVICD
jgi:hypothetical protein